MSFYSGPRAFPIAILTVGWNKADRGRSTLSGGGETWAALWGSILREPPGAPGVCGGPAGGADSGLYRPLHDERKPETRRADAGGSEHLPRNHQ